MREYLRRLGTVHVSSASDEELILIGLHERTSVFDGNLYDYNYADNPSTPASHLVFAEHRRQGTDLFYALDPDDSVLINQNRFAFDYLTNKEAYRGNHWRPFTDDFLSFWDSLMNTLAES